MSTFPAEQQLMNLILRHYTKALATESQCRSFPRISWISKSRCQDPLHFCLPTFHTCKSPSLPPNISEPHWTEWSSVSALCIFDIKSLLLLGLDFYLLTPFIFNYWPVLRSIRIIIMNLLTLAGLLSCLVSHHLKSSLTSSSPVKSLVTFNNSPILTSLSHISSAQLFFLSLFFLSFS